MSKYYDVFIDFMVVTLLLHRGLDVICIDNKRIGLVVKSDLKCEIGFISFCAHLHLGASHEGSQIKFVVQGLACRLCKIGHHITIVTGRSNNNMAWTHHSIENLLVESPVTIKIWCASKAPVYHTRLTSGIGHFEDLVESYKVIHTCWLYFDESIFKTRIIGKMTLQIVGKTVPIFVWKGGVSAHRHVYAQDIGLGRHAHVATIESGACHRAHHVGTMFIQDSITTMLGSQHLGGRTVNHAQHIIIGVDGQGVPEPFDARGAIRIAEGRMSEVEAHVHHGCTDALAGEGLGQRGCGLGIGGRSVTVPRFISTKDHGTGIVHQFRRSISLHAQHVGVLFQLAQLVDGQEGGADVIAKVLHHHTTLLANGLYLAVTLHQCQHVVLHRATFLATWSAVFLDSLLLLQIMLVEPGRHLGLLERGLGLDTHGAAQDGCHHQNLFHCLIIS